MSKKIELKNNRQIQKIESRLIKRNQIETYGKTYVLLLILVLVCIIILVSILILYFFVENLFPNIVMSKLFLDVISNDDITNHIYPINKNLNVISLSHATWNGLPEFIQNSNVSKLINQNNFISCYECSLAIPSVSLIDRKLISNYEKCNMSAHKNLWFSYTDMRHHYFKYREHKQYKHEFEFKYTSCDDIKGFCNSINENTSISTITNKVINFGRSIHITKDHNTSFKCNTDESLPGVIFIQNGDLATSIPYSKIEDELQDKISDILSASNLDNEDRLNFTDLIINRLLDLNDIQSRTYNPDKYKDLNPNTQFIIIRARSVTDLRRINASDLFYPFKNNAIDIRSTIGKLYTILNSISKPIDRNRILLVTEEDTYDSLNFDSSEEDIVNINKKIVQYTREIVENFGRKILDPEDTDPCPIFNITYLDENNKYTNLNISRLLTNPIVYSKNLNDSYTQFKKTFIGVYGKKEYYNFISSLIELCLMPSFKIVNKNCIGTNVQNLSVLTHKSGDNIEISSNISANIIPNKIIKSSSSPHFNNRLLLKSINLDITLENLANIVNSVYATSYSWQDIIQSNNLASIAPNNIATEIISLMEIDDTVVKTEERANLDKLRSNLSIMYHWNNIVADINKFKNIPDKQIIIPDISISYENLESTVKYIIDSEESNFFNKKHRNNNIPRSIYNLLKKSGILLESYMYPSNVVNLENMNGASTISLELLLRDIESYILRSSGNFYSNLHSDLKPNFNKNIYLNKIDYIRSKDLYCISLSYELFKDLNSNEKEFLFDKINQIPDIIYDKNTEASRLFFLVSKKNKKAIYVDTISCIFGTIVDNKIKYADVAQIIHEIIYPISSSKSNLPRFATNFLIPDVSLNDNFYQKINNEMYSIAENLCLENILSAIYKITKVKNLNIYKENGTVTVCFNSDKDITPNFANTYKTCLNKSAGKIRCSIENETSISSILLDLVQGKTQKHDLSTNLSKLMSSCISHINKVPELRMQILTLNGDKSEEKKHYKYEIISYLSDINREHLLPFNSQMCPVHSTYSSEDIKSDNILNKQTINIRRLVSLSPIVESITSTIISDLNIKTNTLKKKIQNNVDLEMQAIQNFDQDNFNKTRQGNKVSHFKLQIVDKLYKIAESFFSD